LVRSHPHRMLSAGRMNNTRLVEWIVFRERK
jgi:hypothetical protein